MKDLEDLRILVVDDNNINRIIAGKALQGLKAFVEFAENGREAIAKASINQYDCILMDLYMPEVDGITATKEIRRKQDGLALPILALTSSTDENDLEQIVQSGMNGVIVKPFTRESLFSQIIGHCHVPGTPHGG